MTTHRKSWRRRAGAIYAALGLALTAAACDSLLQIEDPDIITPESLESAIGRDALRNGALRDFVTAYSGGVGDGIIMEGGLLSDEWDFSGTFVDREEVNTRGTSPNNGTMSTVYTEIQQARHSAENAANVLETADASDERVAELFTLAGYTYVSFGETFCSGVPFSEVQDGSAVEGAAESTQQILERAVARFNTALDGRPISSTHATMAQLGLGRALLGLGRYAEAAAAVSGIATTFEKPTEHSANDPTEENQIWDLGTNQERWIVADAEGANGLPYRSADDPRVQWAATGGAGFDGSTAQINLLNADGSDLDKTDPIMVWSGLQARLIEAEFALQDGRVGDMVNVLQQLRDDSGLDFSGVNTGLSNYVATIADQGSFDDNARLLFQERAFWLYATGHRLGDMRRLARSNLGGYGLGVDVVFPMGTPIKGGTYANGVALPVSDEEDNNSAFDRAACDPAVP